MELGLAFRLAELDGPGHLWVVASDPLAPEGAAIFSITTLRNTVLDRTCIIHASEHPFVHHESVVAYGRGKVLTPVAFKGLRDMGCCQVQPTFKPHLLARVQRGALESDFTPERLQHLVQATLDGRPQV